LARRHSGSPFLVVFLFSCFTVSGIDFILLGDLGMDLMTDDDPWAKQKQCLHTHASQHTHFTHRANNTLGGSVRRFDLLQARPLLHAHIYTLYFFILCTRLVAAADDTLFLSPLHFSSRLLRKKTPPHLVRCVSSRLRGDLVLSGGGWCGIAGLGWPWSRVSRSRRFL